MRVHVHPIVCDIKYINLSLDRTVIVTITDEWYHAMRPMHCDSL
jgi:hypothetical protein